MLPLRNTAARSLSRSTTFSSIASRRFESPVAAEAKPAHGTTGAKPPGKEEEGYPLWILGMIGGGVVLYLATPLFGPTDSSSWMTRKIQDWTKTGPVWEERHKRHHDLVQQAAKDRSLFHDSMGSRTIPDRMPEKFNVGSPINNIAGWSKGRNGEKLKAHYDEEYRIMDEEDAARREATAKRLEEEAEKRATSQIEAGKSA